MKNYSISQHSNNISSTEEFTKTVNSNFYKINTSKLFPSNLNKNNKSNSKDKLNELEQEKINYQKNFNYFKNENKKPQNNKIFFNSMKSLSASPLKFLDNNQKNKKMKLIEINSSSVHKKYKGIQIYNSFNPNLYDSKFTPRIANTVGNINPIERKKQFNKYNLIPISKSFKDLPPTSQRTSNFSKSFHKKNNKNYGNSCSNIHNLSKSGSSLINSKKSLKNSSKTHSLKSYNDYLNPNLNKYLGIDLNLVSNSSHAKNEEINSTIKRYVKNYNYNNDEEENNEGDIIGSNLKTNENYFSTRKTENENEKNNYNDIFNINANTIDENFNINNNKKTINSINGLNEEKKDNNEIINLNIEKDISEINPNLKEIDINKKNCKINQKVLNQFINKPSSINKSTLSKKSKKEELNNSLSNNRPISHIDNNSINQINPSTPVSSFQMYPYEAESSSPTHYIKSNSIVNNLTFLTNNNTNNNSKFHNNKNHINNIKITKDQSEGQSLFSINKSKDDLNQSEFTYINNSIYKGKFLNNNNNSNLISEKEEEKRLTEKLEKNHKLRKNKIKSIDINENNNNTNYCAQNIIEEKEEEYDNIEKINSILIIKDKDKEKEKEKEKNFDFIQQTQDSFFQECAILSETKKFIEKNDKNDKYVNDVNKKNEEENIFFEKEENQGLSGQGHISEIEKKIDLDLNLEENDNDNEEKEIMKRLERLRKEQEKKEEIDMEEKRLIQKLEEEKKKKKDEEERIKNLKVKEKEKMRKILEEEEEKINMVKMEEEKKIKELQNIKEEIKKEEQQRKNLAKKADLLEIKIKKKHINENMFKNQKNKSGNFFNNSNRKDIKKSNSNNDKLNFDYILSENSLNLYNKDELYTKNDNKINSLNDTKENIVNKTYISNPINLGKYSKKYITGGLNSSLYNYNNTLNSIIDKDIYNSPLKYNTENNINNSPNKNIIKDESIYTRVTNSDLYKKNIQSQSNIEQNYIENYIDNLIKKKINNKDIENKSFCRSNSQTKFQLEIISKKNNTQKYYSNSFSSFNFKINSNKNLDYKAKNKNKTFTDDLNEESIYLNSKKKLIENNTNINNKDNKSSTKDVSTQYQDYYNTKNFNVNNNLDKNNNIYLKNYISEPINNTKADMKTSFLNYSKNLMNNKINNENISDNKKTKNDTLFEYDKFKYNYEKLNTYKKFYNSNSLLDKNIFKKNTLKKKNKIFNNEDEDDFYKKKNNKNNMTDNKGNIYDKIPHHIKKGKRNCGLWADYTLSMNKSNINTLGMTEPSTSFYSANNSNKNDKEKFNRKINTFVLPANPFDSVNEARENLFFKD